MQIVFIIVSAVTLFAGIQTVVNRNLFHAALYMMLSFLGVAVLYGMLESAFMAATQLLVYIGAISILVIFAIMMTRRLMQATEAPFNSQAPWGVVASGLLFVLFATVIGQVYPILPADMAAFAPPPAEEAIRGTVVALGESFVSADQYVLAFELASVLLLVALVGAIIVARPDVPENELAEVSVEEENEMEVESMEVEAVEEAAPTEAMPGGH
ncbi:MAG: NADH-quinone oxidoreductase subunit J [Chloroflexota bacterium]